MIYLNCELSLRFCDVTSCWVYSIAKGDFVVQNARFCVSPNILRQYSNVINFGLMVYATDLIDPYLQIDFTSGRIAVYVLNEQEVKDIELEILNYG